MLDSVEYTPYAWLLSGLNTVEKINADSGSKSAYDSAPDFKSSDISAVIGTVLSPVLRSEYTGLVNTPVGSVTGQNASKSGCE